MEIQSGWYEIQQPKQLERKSLMRRHLVHPFLNFFRLGNKEKDIFNYFGISKENIEFSPGEVVFRLRRDKAVEIGELILRAHRLVAMAGYEKPSQMVEVLGNMSFLTSSESTFCPIRSDERFKDVTDVQPRVSILLSLTQAEVQKRREEVRDMAHQGKPMDGIPYYRGRRGGDGDAVSFFKHHYARYIEPGQEVIFSPELSAIDAKLLTALRSECRSPANPMPVGDIGARAEARAKGRFSDGKGAEQATRRAQFRMRSRFVSSQ